MAARRRSWTDAEKLAIVREYDDAPHGSKGAVLATYGIGTNHITAFRNQLGRDVVRPDSDAAKWIELVEEMRDNQKELPGLTKEKRAIMLVIRANDVITEVQRMDERRAELLSAWRALALEAFATEE